MRKYLVKKIRKYVIATLSNPTLYLKKIPSTTTYSFVDNIELATKTLTQKVANQVLQYFYNDSNLNIELVVVPIDISYELIEE